MTDWRLEITAKGRLDRGGIDLEWFGPQFTYSNPDIDGGPWRIRLRWRRTDDGEAAKPCGMSVEADSGTVSAELLRAIPMREIKRLDIQHMRATTKEPLLGSELLRRMPAPKSRDHESRRPRSYRPPHAPSDPVIGPRRDLEELEEIAALWHKLRRRGVTGPAVIIAAEIHLSHSTVRKRIMECRERGLIPKSTRRLPKDRKRRDST
jgi:hypothetical protein